MSSDIERLLSASVEIARRDNVIKLQKNVIANQTTEIKLLNERLKLLENKLLRVADQTGQFDSKCMFFKHQAG